MTDRDCARFRRESWLFYYIRRDFENKISRAAELQMLDAVFELFAQVLDLQALIFSQLLILV